MYRGPRQIHLAERIHFAVGQVQQQMREFFGELVFNTVIHKDVKLAEVYGRKQISWD